jgi:hypothetical protein
MTVLRLLAGERGYASVEPSDVQDALRREAEASSADTTLFRNFPDALVMINRLAAERFLKGDASFAPPSAASVSHQGPDITLAAEVDLAAPEPDTSGAPHFTLDESETHAAQCAYCGGTLPARLKVNFCPHCGQPPSGELRCPACGSEVDVGWAYCASCGRPTGFE